jgi:hypothetical protein
MRRPLERRVRDFCKPRFVPCRFACAFIAERFVMTENDAIDLTPSLSG